MAFPQTPLPLITELLINGAWTVVNDGATIFDRRIADGLTITRGRKDWSSRVTHSSCAQVFENAGGKYSNRNPLSPYFGLLGRNTQIRHRIRWVRDTYGSPISSSWGTTDDGYMWTNTGGSASDYNVAGGKGTHTQTSVNVLRGSQVNLPQACADVVVTMSSGVVATGADITQRVATGSDGNNYYEAILHWAPGGSVTVQLGERVAGVGSTLTSTVAVGSYAANTPFRVRIQRTTAQRVRCKVWPAASAEPVDWTQTVTDTSLTTFTAALLTSRAETGNTNVNPVVSFDDFEVNSYRFWGETSSFSPVWDPSGRNVTVPVEANGIMQRLSVAGKPVTPALNRAIAGLNADDFFPVAYWPMDDGPGSTTFASAIPTVRPAVTTGAVTPSSNSGFPGSLPLPVLNNGTIRGSFPGYTYNQVFAVQFTMMIPSSLSGTGVLYSLKLAPGNTVNEFRVTYQSGDLFVEAFDPNGVQMVNATITSATYLKDTPYLAELIDFMNFASSTRHVQFLLRDGTGLLANFTDFQPDGGGAGTPGVPATFTATGTTGTTAGWSFGHQALFTDANLYGSTMYTANAKGMGGYTGETAGDRMIRLCRESNVPFELVGNTSDTKKMGPQQQGTLLDLLFACTDVDQGVLYEPRDAFGLAYRVSAGLDNQTGPSVGYTSGKLGVPFQPVEDDQLLVNDVTVQRIGGSSARYAVTSGPLSTQDPPNGVGTYDTGVTANVYTDEQCFTLASWLAGKGTWDEARYPVARFQMANPALVADAALSGQLAALDIADVFSVTSLPSWQPPGPAGLMVQGTTESVGDGMVDWELGFNCTPSGVYAPGVYDTARYDSDVTTTAEPLDTTETDVDVRVSSTNTLWVTTAANPAEFPFPVTIDGEDMTVTAIGSALRDDCGRTTASSWGSADTGQAYTLDGGLASDYSVSGGSGRHSVSSVGSERWTFLDLGSPDMQLSVDFTFGVTAAATSPIRLRLGGRFTDSDNFYAAQMELDTGGTVRLLIQKRVATVSTNLTSAVVVGTNTSGSDAWNMTLRTIGSEVKVTALKASAPTAVQTLTMTDTSLTSGTKAGVSTQLVPGNTNTLPVVTTWDHFEAPNPQRMTVTRSVNGIVKSHNSGVAVHVKNPGRYAY